MIIKDKVIPGAIIGILSDVIKLAVNYLAFLFDYTPVVFWQLTATHFLAKKDLFKPIAYLIGGIADLTFSAALGVMFVYFIHYFGDKYLWIKGMGFGLIVWVVFFGTLIGQSIEKKLPQEPAGIVVTMIAHTFFGLSLALFTGWLQRLHKV